MVLHDVPRTADILLPPTKEEVNVFARVLMSVCMCLYVKKITQKRAHGYG